MGGKFTRVFRNFNLENRAHRLISKEKPSSAPRHPGAKNTVQAVISDHPEVKDEIHKKNDVLLSRLKEVFVASSDPPTEVKNEDCSPEEEERRLPKQTMKRDPFALLDVEDIPKGNISIIEALTLLNNHKHSPKTWTAEKIAQEYNLKLHDSQALLEYFIPFDVKLIKSKDKELPET